MNKLNKTMIEFDKHSFCRILIMFLKKKNYFFLISEIFIKIIPITGGENGKKGENVLIKSDGRKIRLGAKTAVDISPGVSFGLYDMCIFLLCT